MDDRTYEQVLSELKRLDEAVGMDMNKLLAFSDDLREMLTWIIRKNKFSIEELAGHLALDTSRTQQLLNLLTLKGYVEFESTQEGKQYHANVTTSKFIRKYRVPKDVWKLLD